MSVSNDWLAEQISQLHAFVRDRDAALSAKLSSLGSQVDDLSAKLDALAARLPEQPMSTLVGGGKSAHEEALRRARAEGAAEERGRTALGIADDLEDAAKASADSPIVGFTLVAAAARIRKHAIRARGEGKPSA